ncbi:MAG TPA: diguanylate cyclase, partial [Ramlibacter sp.]|nr:diguanylate cyclase [Ramlibacter sp.]
MSSPPDPQPSEGSQPDRLLAGLQQQIAEAKARLEQVREQLAVAQNELGDTRSARLVEANERLVLATLAAQRAAQASAVALQEVAQAAALDPLTELPNRVLLRARLALAVSRARQDGGCVALLVLDLTDFKQINDTLGHAVGDKVLRIAARCLAASVRESDTVSRHGSDEFLILLPDVPGTTEALDLAAELVAALGAPVLLDDHVLRLSAAVGISVYPDDGEDADSLVDRAIAAMYRAKWRGLASFAFRGEPATRERSLELRTLESLRNPLTRHEMALAEHQRHHALLQEANTQLVLAALSAQELQAAAENAQRRQTEFMGILAHELRHPLAPIRNAAAILGRIADGGPVLVKTQAVIERHVSQMSRMVGDLLDVSRVNTGKLRIERHTIDLIQLLDEVVDACRPAMDARLQHFIILLPAHSIEVHGDPVRLAQVFNNLLDNASKYTPKNGDIRLTAAIVGNQVQITISDNGIGISPVALESIFDPFVQDPHATEFDASGLGIGLTVVRELI